MIKKTNMIRVRGAEKLLINSINVNFDGKHCCHLPFMYSRRRQPNGNCNNFAAIWMWRKCWWCLNVYTQRCKWATQKKIAVWTLHIAMNTRQCQLTPSSTNTHCIKSGTFRIQQIKPKPVWDSDCKKKVFHCNFSKVFAIESIHARADWNEIQIKLQDRSIGLCYIECSEVSFGQFPFIH